MARDNLLGFFEDFARLDDTFIVHDDGYRSREATYREIATAAHAFAGRLDAAGITRGDKVILWSENRIEWVVALWGALLAGVVVVPIDFRVSEPFLKRVSEIVGAKAILVGDDVPVLTSVTAPVWKLRDVAGVAPSGDFVGRAFSGPADAGGPERSALRTESGTLAEIIFTSGATAEPKGVTITHRNLLANIIPIEREVRKYRKWERPFHPIRF